MKYLVVSIEYFIRWIEAEPVAQITSHKIQHFLWKNIVCRFGIPKRLVSDNGTQFASQQLGKLCMELGIKQVFASVEHPQTNGQVESGNRFLLGGLNRRLEKAKANLSDLNHPFEPLILGREARGLGQRGQEQRHLEQPSFELPQQPSLSSSLH